MNLKDILLRPLRVDERWHYVQRIIIMFAIIGGFTSGILLSPEHTWWGIGLTCASGLLLAFNWWWIEWWVRNEKKSELTTWENRLDKREDQIDEAVDKANAKYNNVTFTMVDDERLLVTYGDGSEAYMVLKEKTTSEVPTLHYTPKGNWTNGD